MSGRMGACKFVSYQFGYQGLALALRSALQILRESFEVLLPIADFAPSSSHSQSHIFASRAVSAYSSGQRLAATDLEDIGDGNGVLGGLALRGDDGDGRPGHGGCRELPVVSIAVKVRAFRELELRGLPRSLSKVGPSFAGSLSVHLLQMMIDDSITPCSPLSCASH